MAGFRSFVCCLAAVSMLCVGFASAQEGGGDLPELDDTGVVVPWSDFKRILDDLRRPTDPPPPPPPPVGHALSACRVEARGDRDGSRLQVRLQYSVQILEPEEWVEVHLAPSGLALEQVRIDGAQARLYTSGGFHSVAFRGPGGHEVIIDALVPVAEIRGRHVANIALPAASGIDLNLEVFGEEMEFEIDGAVVRSVESANGRTGLRAALYSRGSTRISWFEPADSDQKDSSLVAEVGTLVSIGEGSLRGVSSVAMTIHGQGVRQFLLEVPSAIEILDVRGQGLSDWSVGPAVEERAALEVSIGFAAESSYVFEVDFESAIEGGEALVSLPDIEVKGVRRERGFIAVAAATNVEITPVGELKNAAMVDPVEMPPNLAARAGDGTLYLFKYLRHPTEVSVSVVKHQDLLVKRTIVEQCTITTYAGPRGRRLSTARYSVKNNRKQYLAIDLPEDAVLWGAFREGQPVKAASRADGAVLVPLKKTALAQEGALRPFDVEVTWFEDRQRGSRIARLAFVAPAVDVDVLDMQWQLFLPRDGRYFGYDGTLATDAGGYELRVVDGLSYSADELHPAKAKAAAAAPPVEEKEEEALEQLQWQDLRSQVGSSNVAQGFDLSSQSSAGRARGVLPVKVVVPKTGVPLRFSGRLVTAEEAAQITMWTVPAGWKTPTLGPSATGLFSCVLLLVGGVAMLVGARGKMWWATSAAAVLVLLFFASAPHRSSFFTGLIVAAVFLWVVRWFRNREAAHEEGF